MVTESVEMARFESSLLVVLEHSFVGLALLLLGDLELGGVEVDVAHSITEDGNSAADITLEAVDVEAGDLTVSFG